MELSSVPSRLLSPAAKAPTQGYFSVPIQRDSISRTASPSEDLANSTYLSPSIASASCASTSDLWSGTSNRSVESYHLTPPLTLPDYEKPPYKARSESAASLNMSRHQGDETMGKKDARRGKTRRSRRKHRKHPGSLCQPAKSTGNRGDSLQYFPGYEGDVNTPTDSGVLGYRNIGTDHSREGTKTVEMNDDNKGAYSTQLMSVLADAVTTRRWSSVGIGDSLPKAMIRPGADGSEKMTHTLNRSNTWNASADCEIINAVRARLTIREVSMDTPQNPTAITLRRASGVPGNDVRYLSTAASLGITESVVPEQDQKVQQRRPLLAYLVTKEDIDSITDMIQSRLALRPKESVLNPDSSQSHWPSATDKGALHSKYAPINTAKTTEDVKQAPAAPQSSSGEMKRPVLKRAGAHARKLSKAFARKSVPEVIWEDCPSPESFSPCSHTSSSSRSASHVISKSIGEKPAKGNTVITNCEETSSPAASAEEFSRRISAQGDTSPTSRVFKWVFKKPLTEDKRDQDKPSDDDPLEALAKWKLPKLSPPTKTWKSLENHSTPTGDKPDVLSFPPLCGRQSTIDWFSPLPDMSAPVEQGKRQASCLYDAGIDARTSAHKKSIASLPGLSILQVTAKEPRHSLKSSKSNIESRRKSSALLYPNPTPRTGEPFTVGNALGVSSGARRKSSAKSVRIKIDIEGLDRHNHADGRSWIKPRKDSGWPARKLPSPEEMASRKASAVRGRKEEDKNRRRMQERSRLTGGLAPCFSGADRQGVHGALTAAKADTVISEVLCLGHGCGPSVSDARTVSAGLIR